MKGFFVFSALYFIFAWLFTPIFMQTDLGGFMALLIGTNTVLSTVRTFFIGFLIGLVVLLLTVGYKTLLTRYVFVLISVISLFFMHAGFLLLKNVMPFIIPYFADPFMADLDKFLHFGIDPWVVTHKVAQYLPMEYLGYAYWPLWAVTAILLPLIIAASDGDKTRVNRTLVIYAVAWVFVGNILAFAGLSVGPVYYDRLLGGDRFSGLTEVLVTSGFASSHFWVTQQALWDIYVNQALSIGSGISAFPSVHVAVATVSAIYISERSKWLFPIAVLFLSAIQFYSVYSGFHYAIDGYFSIIFILAVWWLLKRKYPSE